MERLRSVKPSTGTRGAPREPAQEDCVQSVKLSSGTRHAPLLGALSAFLICFRRLIGSDQADTLGHDQARVAA
jgi:hypothetical protein